MGSLHIGLYSTLCASGPLNKGRSLEWGLREEKGDGTREEKGDGTREEKGDGTREEKGMGQGRKRGMG